MIDLNKHVSKVLLDPFNITKQDIVNGLNLALSTGGSYADLYMQNRTAESWFLEDNKVKQSLYEVIQGAAIHVTHNEQSGFAYTEDISKNSIMHIAKQAGLIAKGFAINNCTNLVTKHYTKMYGDYCFDVINAKKIDLLYRLNEFAYKECEYISKVRASLSVDYDIIYFANNLGEEVCSTRPMVRLDVFIVLTKDGHAEQGHAGLGGRYGLNDFLATNPEQSVVIEALNVAKHALQAKQAPAGNMPVVLGSGWPGVLLHEAVGHGLEADFNRKKSSIYTEMLGKKIASSICNVVDNALIPNCRGSLAIDDEGVVGQETLLIENGVLSSFMTDRLSAKIMQLDTTGNGRRESYAHIPMPRMTNTYMQAGEDDPIDIIKSVDKGIYCTNFSGGQVDITSGKFVFAANVAFLIENGKLTYPVKNLTLIGDGAEVLQKISMIGYDLSLDNGVGVCGKDGQSVPVGVGQPSLKIDDMTVGGADYD